MITTFFGWFSVRTYQQTSSTVSTELRERSEENLNQKEMEREKVLSAEQAENEKVTEDGAGEDSSSSTPFCTDDEDEGEDEGEA